MKIYCCLKKKKSCISDQAFLLEHVCQRSLGWLLDALQALTEKMCQYSHSQLDKSLLLNEIAALFVPAVTESTEGWNTNWKKTEMIASPISDFFFFPCITKLLFKIPVLQTCLFSRWVLPSSWCRGTPFLQYSRSSSGSHRSVATWIYRHCPLWRLVTLFFLNSSAGFDLTEKFLLWKGTVSEDLPSFRLGSSPLIKPTRWAAFKGLGSLPGMLSPLVLSPGIQTVGLKDTSHCFCRSNLAM